jgi:hypothetical protein
VVSREFEGIGMGAQRETRIDCDSESFVISREFGGAEDTDRDQGETRIDCISRKSGWPGSPAFPASAPVFALTVLYFPVMNAGQVGQIRGSKVRSTILGVVVGAVLLSVSGIVVKTIHRRILWRTTSDIESQFESATSTSSSVSGFETFISEENGLTHDQSFLIENNSKDSGIEESFFHLMP